MITTVATVVACLAVLAAVGLGLLGRTARREVEIRRRYPGALLIPIVTTTPLLWGAQELRPSSRFAPAISATIAIDRESTIRYFTGSSRPRAQIVLRRGAVAAVREGPAFEGGRAWPGLLVVARGPAGLVDLPAIVTRRRSVLGLPLPSSDTAELVVRMRRALLL